MRQKKGVVDASNVSMVVAQVFCEFEHLNQLPDKTLEGQPVSLLDSKRRVWLLYSIPSKNLSCEASGDYGG